MSQTAYNDTMRARIAGMLADSGMKDARTFVSEEASAGIAFGACVARGAGSDGAVLPSGSALKLLGPVLHAHAYDPDPTRGDLNASGEIKPKTEIAVLRRGRIAVPVENACNPGDKLCVRAVAGAGGSVLGLFRKTAVSGETTAALDAAEVVEGTTGAGIAVIEWDAMKLPASIALA